LRGVWTALFGGWTGEIDRDELVGFVEVDDDDGEGMRTEEEEVICGCQAE
jgi:hypothetical protein